MSAPLTDGLAECYRAQRDQANARAADLQGEMNRLRSRVDWLRRMHNNDLPSEVAWLIAGTALGKPDASTLTTTHTPARHARGSE